MFGGLASRSGSIFVAHGGARGGVTVVDGGTFEVLRRLPLLGESGRPVLAAGIAVGPTFVIHVADSGARVVRSLSMFGTGAGRLGEPSPRALPYPPDRRGLLAEPAAVAVDDSGSVYVTSVGGPRVYAVQKYARTGRFLGSFRSFGVAGETFSSPRGIAVRDDRVWIADSGNGAVQVFRRNGAFRQAFSTAVRAGERSYPISIAVDPAGALLVLDRGDAPTLRRFTAGGELLTTVLTRDQIDGPISVAAGDDGRILVLDHDGDRLRAFDPDGTPSADLTALLGREPRSGVRPGASYRRGP